MKRGDHVAALLHPHRVAVVCGRARLLPAPKLADDGSADEHGFQVASLRHGDVCDAAIDLAPVGVALDGDVHQTEACLRGMRDFARQQNRAGATSVNRLLPGEALERFGEPFLIEQLQHGSAFAAGDDQAVALLQVGSGAHFDGVAAGAVDRFAMRFEVALEGQNPGGFLQRYQPRVCSSSLSGSLEISRPRMASPNSSLASSSFTGSL